MNENDKKAFGQLIKATMEYYDKKASPQSVGIYWNGLKEFDFEAIKTAFSQQVNENSFMPKVADIRGMMTDTSGWLSANEAWSVLPKTEYDGGYVTQEMASATPYDLIDSGDMIAARMAFIPAYERAVTTAKAEGKQPHWFYSAPSQGDYETKIDIKESALLLAQEKKWITPNVCSDAMKQLNRPTQLSQDMQKMLSKCRTEIGLSVTESE